MNTPTRLPRLNWMGIIYTIDFRLCEARPESRPHEAISFCAMPENMKAEVRGVRFRETTLGYIKGLDD